MRTCRKDVDKELNGRGLKEGPVLDRLYSVKMRAARNGDHISGAEGIYVEEMVNDMISSYLNRAFGHAKGPPDSIRIKVEPLREEPRALPLMNIMTVASGSVRSSRNLIWELLCHLGISREAIHSALHVIYGQGGMRGAAVIHGRSGERMEPDRVRGVRVTGLGITEEAAGELAKKLAPYGLNNATVKEAVVLASKVLSHDAVIAELCVSDDPDYTTGYIAGYQKGYVRIPNMKEPDSPAGGRVFFVRDGVDIGTFIEYLERTPVMIDRVSDIGGEVRQDEFLSGIAG